MKKNLMTVLIMALVFVNVVLSAIIMITFVPMVRQSNQLITDVCNAIDLELESGKVYNVSTIPVDQIELYALTAASEPQTFNLKDDADGEKHYAVAEVSLSINKEDSDYDDLNPMIEGREALIMDLIGDTFMSYTYSDIMSDRGEALKDEMLGKIQELFDSDFIIAVNLSPVQYQ